jgi:hypothetical protein
MQNASRISRIARIASIPPLLDDGHVEAHFRSACRRDQPRQAASHDHDIK